MTKINNHSFDYQGGDLEAMVGAKQYYRWVLNSIKDYIGQNVVEVGAGVGSFSKHIATRNPKKMLLIEPSKRMYTQLNQNPILKELRHIEIQTINGYLEDAAETINFLKPDTFIYINVFEHIEDDVKEIQRLQKHLAKDGHVIIFVPAMQKLYSQFDKSIDHYRRYSKKSLKQLCESAGLEVVKLHYMDMVGVVPWWFSFVLMKRTKLVPALVKTYDTLFVPIIRSFESVLPVPLGKNVLVVAKKI